MLAAPALSISAKTISSFIAKVHRLEDRNTASNGAGSYEALEHHVSPALQELANIIDGLTDDEQADMIALMWLGRGDGEIAEWNELREEAAVLHNKRATAYLLAKPMLVDHLAEGLAALGYSSKD